MGHQPAERGTAAVADRAGTGDPAATIANPGSAGVTAHVLRGIAGFALLALIACSGTAGESIPEGAQIVRVAITESEVALDHQAVSGGDVYLIIESPVAGHIEFIERQAADGVPHPLTDADLIRLRNGDTQDMSLRGFDWGNCTDEENLRERGKLGRCGNVMKVRVVPGQYAIVAGTADGGLGPLRAPMTVLRVLP